MSAITDKRNEIIWKTYHAGGKSQQKIADEFGLSQSRVYNIIKKMDEKYGCHQISDFPSLDDRLKIGWKHLDEGLTENQLKPMSVKGIVNNLMRAVQGTEWAGSPEKFLQWLVLQTKDSLCRIRGIGPQKAEVILTIQQDILNSDEPRKELLKGCKWVYKGQKM